MSGTAEHLVVALVVLTGVPVTLLLLEVLSALGPQRTAARPATGHPRLAVLVPAHNESAGIRDTLLGLLGQLAKHDRVVVIADNCSDDTAQVARTAGAETIERHDGTRRGKGYALDFGVRHLAKNLLEPAPEVVVVVDADCTAERGALEALARLSVATGRPVQGRYLMRSRGSGGPLAALAEFAWIVKNAVRPLGMRNAGLPCHLMGSGMALPWDAVRTGGLATGHITEDLSLGIMLARQGNPPLYCPEALVTSYFPMNDEGVRAQRTRWEHGHLSVILECAPGLLFDGIRRMDPGLIALALDICVPPLALLALIVAGLTGLCALHAWLSGSLLALGATAVLTALFLLAIGLSWWRFARETVSCRHLLLAPLYALRKIPIYIGFVGRRQKTWIRTRRDE